MKFTITSFLLKNFKKYGVGDISYCDILSPPKEVGSFSFDTTNVVSISELTPCVPRLFTIYHANLIRMPSFLIFIAAL